MAKNKVTIVILPDGKDIVKQLKIPKILIRVILLFIIAWIAITAFYLNGSIVNLFEKRKDRILRISEIEKNLINTQSNLKSSL